MEEKMEVHKGQIQEVQTIRNKTLEKEKIEWI